MKQVLRQFFMIALILSLLLSTLGIQLIVHGLDEAPAPEAPAPEDPAPEAPAPEDPAPEDPAPEAIALGAPAPGPHPPISEGTYAIKLIIHPNNGYGAENITIPMELRSVDDGYNTITYSFTVDQSFDALLESHNIKKPSASSEIAEIKAFNPDSNVTFAYLYNSASEFGLDKQIRDFSDPAYKGFNKVVETGELHIIVLWRLATGQPHVGNHVHCFLQPPFGSILSETEIQLDSGSYITKLTDIPEINFYALEGGSLSYLYHGNVTTRTADGKHFRIVGDPSSRPARWVDIIYCMKESWANYPAQEAYIMPEPVPDEGYAFDYWEESRVPTVLKNLFEKIENQEKNDNSLSYLIEHPWGNDGMEPGDGALEWDMSDDIESPYYSIMSRTGLTYIAHFKKIDVGSRLIPCPYGVCINQPTPYVVEPIVNPIVKPIEKPAPLNLPRTASAQK